MKHTLVATMEDGPAVLNRVVSLFRQRGFAIDSLTIGKTHEAHVMRLTMVVDGSKTAVEQVVKQLQKAIACSEAEGWEIAWQVHNTGKAVVKIGPEAECVRVGNILASIGLVVTVVQS